MNATTYYVSAKGNDASSGTSAATPWLSIAKINVTSLKPGDAVLFNRGDTFYGTLSINQSGVAGNFIVYGAYGTGAAPIITGFTTISSWINDGGGIYEYTCSPCQPTLNMVTVNDTLQPMGRWPRISDANEGYLTVSSHTGNTSISSSQISASPSFVGGEVVIRKVQYLLDRATISAQTSTTVTYNPSSKNTFIPTDKFGFFFQNHVNTLKKTGDWCYDFATKKIKIYGNPPNVNVTTLSSLVNITNKSYISINALSFKGSNSNVFNISSSNNIQINYCYITYAGVDAIYLNDSNSVCNNIKVYGCTISNSNSIGIDASSSTNMIVTNNIIRNTGMIRGAGQSGNNQHIGMVNIGSKSLIQYNQVINTGYHSIMFHGDSVIVKNNFINGFCETLNDGGGIYTYGDLDQGRIIRSNIVINGIGDRYGINSDLTNPYGGNVHGIYMDGGTRNVLIDSNTVANCAFDGLELGSPVGIQVLNNTFFDNTTAQIDFNDMKNPVSNVIFKRNILFSRRPDQLVAKINISSDYVSSMGTIDSNYYCRSIYEPIGINTRGFTHSGSWAYPYCDGGIIYYSTLNRFYSLDIWKTISKQDAHTLKTPMCVTQLTEPLSCSIDSLVRFEYNATASTRSISLANNKYIDIHNNSYSGTLNLAPYSSVILMYTGLLNIVNGLDSAQQLSMAETNVEQSITEKIILYPNPARGLVNLRLISESNGPVRINIFDMSGKVVQEVQLSKDQAYLDQSFNISRLANGIYNLQVLVGYHKRMITQFVKQ